MEEIQITLQSGKTIRYNDEVYPRVFELAHYIYNFSVQPKVKFWRFGIRLSSTKEIDFYHPSGRYKNPAPVNVLEDVHLGVGDWESEIWSNSNKLHLAQYHLKEYPTEFGACDSYIEKSKN
jgi:hypothetical protein